MRGKVLVVTAAVMLMAGLIAAMSLLRYYGADGACGPDDAGRKLGAVFGIGECR